MIAAITNPLTRKRIAALYYVQASDEEISEKLGIPVYKVMATRRDMKLMRTTGRLGRLTGGFDKTGIPTTKKRPTNKNARVNQFAVLRAYLDQEGSKNMSKVAKQFNCTRAYVSYVLKNAREGGLLDDRNDLYVSDHEQAVEKALEAIGGLEEGHN